MKRTRVAGVRCLEANGCIAGTPLVYRKTRHFLTRSRIFVDSSPLSRSHLYNPRLITKAPS